MFSYFMPECANYCATVSIKCFYADAISLFIVLLILLILLRCLND